MTLKLVIALALTAAIAMAQEVPDAPQPQPPAAPVSIWHQNWYDYYAAHHRANAEVLRSKAFWATFLGDVAITTYDAEMTHEGLAHHRCVEANVNPPYPSRWQLYRSSLRENAAVGVVAFLWVKAKGPKWVLPGFLAGPAYAHIRAGTEWYTGCW